jgi:hypothetical protein
VADRTLGEGRTRRWLIGALVALAIVGVALAGFSAYRLYARHGHGRPPPGPRQTDVSLIAGWMTVPYVSRTYHVPPQEIFRAVGVPPQGHERDSLNELAAASGRSSDEVVAAVRAAVQTSRTAHPPLGPQSARRTPEAGGGG